MARISFTSETEEIVGRLAGSVFQDSYCGYQVRGISTPRNPQTQLQQLRRGDFRFLSSSWRNLTTTEQNTWIAEAGTVPEALRLFIGNNSNLLLIGQSIINSYSSSTSPGQMQTIITNVSDTVFTVAVTTGTNVVPAGTTLLLFATFDNSASALFNNPAAYQPIIYFPAGTSFAADVDIFSAWSSHYGVLRLNRNICIKSVLVNTTNGTRGAEFINCSISTPVIANDVIDSDGTFVIDSDGTFITAI